MIIPKKDTSSHSDDEKRVIRLSSKFYFGNQIKINFF